MEALIGIGIFIVIIGVSIAISTARAKKRIADLSELATAMHLSYAAEVDAGILESLRAFKLFTQGRKQRISNMIFGITNEVDMRIFDYKYTTGHGKNRKDWHQTVMLFTSDKLLLPNFVLRPENIFHKIGQVFGYQDIDFNENPAFSRRYLLRGEDEPAIRNTFNRQILKFYEDSKGLSTEGFNQQLIFYRSNKRLKPQKIRELMSEGFKVFALFVTQ